MSLRNVKPNREELVEKAKTKISVKAVLNGVYCQTCKGYQTIENVRTEKLPNLTIVHKGSCAKCGSVLWKRVKENELFYDAAGHKIPKQVFVGKLTPKSWVIGRVKKPGEVLRYVRSKTDIR